MANKSIDVLYHVTQFKGGSNILPRDRKIVSDIYTMRFVINLLDLADHLGNEHLKILFGSYFAMHLMGLPQTAVQERISALQYN